MSAHVLWFPRTVLARWKERMRARIRRNVEIDAISGCWIWARAQDGRGYGQMNIRTADGAHRSVKAHRIAYIAFKRWPPAGRPEIAHAIQCVAPLCCNPAHLRATTRSENERDKARAKRWRLREIARHALNAPARFKVAA